MKFLTITFLLFTVLSLPLFSGGSIRFEKVKPLLESNPALWHYLSHTLDFNPVGDARRFGRQWTYLGGKRLCPYTFLVTSKADSHIHFNLQIDCQLSFYDKAHNILPLDLQKIDKKIFFKTVSFQEKLRSITLLPIPKDKAE